MTPGVDSVRAANISFELASYEHDPRTTAYGIEASDALDVAPARVFKTLIAKLDDGRLVTVVLPVDRQLDLKVLANTFDTRRASIASVEEAERVTGYVVGGISPLGQRRRLATVIDESAHEYETIYVSAGRRGLEILLDPNDLAALTDAILTSLTRDNDALLSTDRK